jgi:hypothetical protein
VVALLVVLVVVVVVVVIDERLDDRVLLARIRIVVRDVGDVDCFGGRPRTGKGVVRGRPLPFPTVGDAESVVLRGLVVVRLRIVVRVVVGLVRGAVGVVTAV